MPQQFGYATVLAQSQTPEGTVSGANPAQPAFLAGSACMIGASFFDNTGAPMAPQALSYQISDARTGAQILAPTSITPQAVIEVEVTSEQNAIISNSLRQETHEVVMSVTDRSGNGPFLARCWFDLVAGEAQ